MNCDELSEEVIKTYHIPLKVAVEIIRESRMTDNEILNWTIPDLPNGGGSKQPKLAFSLPPNERDTLADVIQRGQEWELKQALGNNWRKVVESFKGKRLITVYRASVYPIIAGSYVTESRDYALFHRDYVNAPEYYIYSLDVSLSSLMWLGDTHEFIYAPTLKEWKEVAYMRALAFPSELQEAILSCKNFNI